MTVRSQRREPQDQHGATGPGAAFAPYLPRLALEWIATEPDRTYRAVDGTMVFVDVSGFTALTERLARRGRAGAEELTSILDGVFTRLLTVAWELGGSLVKFGGDALLLLFTGPGHAARACAAAYDMRSELDVVGRIDAFDEPVTLRMSVGVHTGRFDYFLVGGSHRELILTGPAATRTVATESAAEAGQILVSDDVAVLLDPGSIGRASDTARLLVGRPEAPARPVELPDVTGAPISRGVPVGLRRHLASEVTTPEHRMVTTGFVHFLGVDERLATDGPEQVAGAVDQVVTAIQRHLDEHGLCFLSSDIYGDGGKLIVTAGAPTASGNDEERMLRALRGLFDEHLPLPIRAGVNRGHVYAGEIGPAMRRTYTVMGDAVNLAARLMQAAQPGAILTTGPVLDRSRTQFAVTALPPFHVKGKARPVDAYELGAVTGWRRTSRARLPLVGREAELQRLLDAVESARAGRGSVIQLVGAAGIGKTRLVEEVRARGSELRQLSIACEQYERSTPFWSFLLLLRRLLDIPFDASPEEAGVRLEQYVRDEAPDLLPWLPLLAIPVDAEVPTTPEVDALDEQFRRQQLERATATLIDGLVTTPTLLIFEDLYWLDEASQALLRLLGARAAERPWVLLLTNRDLDHEVMPEDAQHGTSLRLAALTADEMEALATVASELSPRPTHELTVLADRAGGSPLFLLELLSGTPAGHASEGLPDSIEAAITARIDQLEPEDRALLRCAAVLGQSFPVRLAQETLATWAAGAADLDAWRRLGEFVQLETRDRARFQHALIHDVAYEGLPYRQRRALHGEIAERLEQEADDAELLAELLALHFLRAERFDPALRYSRLAGDRARAKAASVDAATFYRQALEAAQKAGTDPATVVDLAEVLGEVCELAGLYDEGARSLRIARRHVDDPVRQAVLLRREGLILDRVGRYEHARRVYRAGLRLLRDLPEDDRRLTAQAELEARSAAALVVEGRYRACVWWARRAANHAQRAGAKEVLAHAYYLLDWAFSDLGDARTADYRGRALPIYEQLGDFVGVANVLNNLGASAYYDGRWDEAVVYYERSRQARERAGDVVQAATAAANIAEVLAQQGHLERAEALFREALRVFRGAGYGAGIAWATGYLGLVAARLGRYDDGRTRLAESRDRLRGLGAESLVLEATGRLAEVNVLAGDHRTARSLLVPSLEQVNGKEGLAFLQATLHRLHAYALLQGNDVNAAGRELAAALALATETDTKYEVALTLRAQAEVADLLGAPDDGASERAAVLFDELGVVATPEIPLPDRDALGEHIRSGVRPAPLEGRGGGNGASAG